MCQASPAIVKLLDVLPSINNPLYDRAGAVCRLAAARAVASQPPERVGAPRQRCAGGSSATGGRSGAAGGAVPSSVHIQPMPCSFVTKSRACVSQ